MSELREVVEELQHLATPFSKGGSHCGMMEARRALKVIRELAADFERYRAHRPHCRKSTCDERIAVNLGIVCTCGLDAAREKWRLL